MSFALYALGVVVVVFTAQALLVTPRLVAQWEVEGAHLNVLEVLYVNASSAVASIWWMALVLGVGLIVAGSVLRWRKLSAEATQP